MADIPPWLDYNPSVYVNAALGGRRAALEEAQLAQRGQEFGAEEQDKRGELALAQQRQGQATNEDQQQLQLQRDKLAQEAGESAADRALKSNLSQNEEALAQNKFNAGNAIDNAALNLHKAQFDFQSAQKQQVADRLSKARQTEADILKDFDATKPLLPEIAKNPDLMSDPAFVALAKTHDTQLAHTARANAAIAAQKERNDAAISARLEIADRSKASRSNPTEKDTIDPSTGRVMEKVISKPYDPGAAALGGGGAQPQALPSKKSDLVKGSVYNLKGAAYTWDGDNFVKVKPSDDSQSQPDVDSGQQ